MADEHFSRFQQIDAAEKSILTELEDSSWGRLFSFQEIMVLAKHMTAYRLPPGGTLFKEGDRAPFLCLVYAGQVDVFKEDGQGVQKWLISIGKGKTLGEMSLIDKEPRSATCRAKMQTDVLILDEEASASLKQSTGTLSWCELGQGNQPSSAPFDRNASPEQRSARSCHALDLDVASAIKGAVGLRGKREKAAVKARLLG